MNFTESPEAGVASEQWQPRWCDRVVSR